MLYGSELYGAELYLLRTLPAPGNINAFKLLATALRAGSYLQGVRAGNYQVPEVGGARTGANRNTDYLTSVNRRE